MITVGGTGEDARMQSAVRAAWKVLFRYGVVKPGIGMESAMFYMHVDGSTNPAAIEALKIMRETLTAALRAYEGFQPSDRI